MIGCDTSSVPDGIAKGEMLNADHELRGMGGKRAVAWALYRKLDRYSR